MQDLSLFRSTLGVAFDNLAPALRRHYDLLPDQQILMAGHMKSWIRFGGLRLFIPFAPLNSERVQVTVRNSGVRDAQGQICYHWAREFRYPNQTQHTETLTKPTNTIDPNAPTVLDTFTQPPVAVTLKLLIEENGRALKQVAAGSQYAFFGRTRLALPSFMRLNTVATERALSGDTLYTEVTIGHPLLGRLFGYAGELKLQ